VTHLATVFYHLATGLGRPAGGMTCPALLKFANLSQNLTEFSHIFKLVCQFCTKNGTFSFGTPIEE